ncbi:MAG: prephenate dehydrogenase [Nocardioidaceae bacterium]
MADRAAVGVSDPVLVVGAGLLGTSIGMALSRAGVTVHLHDLVAEHVRTATALGAGRPLPAPPSGRLDVGAVEPALVVVAVPPDHLGASIAEALLGTGAVVTDVGSVKAAPLDQVRSLVGEQALSRYVGSHPMAGSERSGPLAASAALFDGRPWAVVPHAGADPGAIEAVTALARACGATPVRFTPEDHDRAVARTSHLPHLLAALVAGRLADAPVEHLALSGQGVRDVTRIAAGDPGLWQQIVAANTTALAELLVDVRDDLDRLLAALAVGDRTAVAGLLDRGVAGQSVIPAKHGGAPRPEVGVFVVVPDTPGELARLFAHTGEIGVNIEDLRIDHDPVREYGLVELTVAAASADHLLGSLEARGWTTHR